MKCRRGQWLDDGECKACRVDNCSECRGKGRTCTACKQGYELVDNECVLICREGQYNSNGRCK